jgi:hypothetical protein
MSIKNFKLFVAIFALLFLASCVQDEIAVTGNIVGAVYDSSTNEPLNGVNVRLNPSGYSRTTSGDGSFEFTDLEPKQYELQASKVGYMMNKKSVTVRVGRDISCDIMMLPEVVNGKLSINTGTLDFGTKHSSLSFTISNEGNKSFNWNITGINSLDWLDITPTTGVALAPGASQSVVVTLKRNRITEYKEAIILINADGESLPLKIMAEAEEKNSMISLSTNALYFGTEYSSLTFDVRNIGNAGDISWTITDIDADWIAVSPTSGTTSVDKSSVVKVDVDRSRMEPGKHSITIIVNADGQSLRLTINAERGADRYLEVKPKSLALGGVDDSAQLTIESHNGATSYEIATVGDDSWASIDKKSGVAIQYNPADPSSVEVVTITVDRTGLAAGQYGFTLVVRSDLGEIEVPVTMNVNEVGTNGLTSYYKFEGGYEDSSESEVAGYGMNSPTFVQGVSPDSKAVKFSRSNNSQFVVPQPIIDSRDMTIAFWAQNLSDGNIFYMVSSKNSEPMFTLSMSGGQLKFVVTRYDNGYQYAKTGAFSHPALSDGKWHHIALTSDFNKTSYANITTSLYVDGQLVDTITEYANPYSEAEVDKASYGTGTKFVMGGSVKLNNSLTLNGVNMSIDNFRVYASRRLSAQEIKEIYKAKQ